MVKRLREKHGKKIWCCAVLWASSRTTLSAMAGASDRTGLLMRTSTWAKKRKKISRFSLKRVKPYFRNPADRIALKLAQKDGVHRYLRSAAALSPSEKYGGYQEQSAIFNPTRHSTALKKDLSLFRRYRPLLDKPDKTRRKRHLYNKGALPSSGQILRCWQSPSCPEEFWKK